MRPYFLNHRIAVRIDHPLSAILGKMDASGGMLKWDVENGESEISYEPRNAIKDQALANFIWETTRRGGGTSLGVVCRWNGDKAMSMSRYCFSKPK